MCLGWCEGWEEGAWPFGAGKGWDCCSKAAEKAPLCPSAPVSSSGCLAFLCLTKDHTVSFPKPALRDCRFFLSCAISQQNYPGKAVNNTSPVRSGQGGRMACGGSEHKRGKGKHLYLSILARG